VTIVTTLERCPSSCTLSNTVPWSTHRSYWPK